MFLFFSLIQYLYSVEPIGSPLSQERQNSFKRFVSENFGTTMNLDQLLDRWLSLLSPDGMTRIEQIKIRKESTGLVVFSTACAFNQHKAKKMSLVQVGSMRIETCSKEAGRLQEEPEIFDTFICALKKIMGEKMFTRNGIDAAHDFGWIVINGHVYPYPYAKAKGHISTMHWAMPYGPFVDGKQVCVTLIDGSLVQTPGFFMSWPTTEDNTFKLVMTNGAPFFTNQSRSIRLAVNHPFAQEYTAGLQSGKSAKAYTQISEEGVFFPLPAFDDSRDDVLFQGALLDAIQDLGIPITTSSVIEDAEGAAAIAASTFEPDLSFSMLEEHSPISSENLRGKSVFASNPFYQKLVEQEWEIRQAAVLAQQVAPSAKEQKRTFKGKSRFVRKIDDLKMLPETPIRSSDFYKDSVISEIWKGRVKFKEVARLIARQIQESGAEVCINRKGSHIQLHFKINRKESGMTLVRPHGASAGELSAHNANSLIDQVNDLLASSSPSRHR